jgi:uncharacterized protein YuzE
MNLLKEYVKYKYFMIKIKFDLIKSRYVNKVVNKHIHTTLPKGIKKLHHIYQKHLKQNRGLKTMYFIFHNRCAIKFKDDWYKYYTKRNEELKNINPIFRKIFNIKYIDSKFTFPCEIIYSNKLDGKNYIELVEMGNNLLIEEDYSEDSPVIGIKIKSDCSSDVTTKYTYDEIFI